MSRVNLTRGIPEGPKSVDNIRADSVLLNPDRPQQITIGNNAELF